MARILTRPNFSPEKTALTLADLRAVIRSAKRHGLTVSMPFLAASSLSQRLHCDSIADFAEAIGATYQHDLPGAITLTPTN